MRPDSPIKNIALVLGTLYVNTSGWSSGEPEFHLQWRGAIIRKARRHGFVFRDVPYGIEETLKNDAEEWQEEFKDVVWTHFKWKREVLMTCGFVVKVRLTFASSSRRMHGNT
jgi:hypothetical protein